MERRTYNVEEVAEQLGVSRATAYEMVRQGKIPSLTLGRRRVIPIAAFDTWLASAGQAQTAAS